MNKDMDDSVGASGRATAAEPVVSALRGGIPDAESGDWWIGANDEYMNIGGPVATREKAIEIGRDYMGGDPFYITRAGLHAWSAPDAATVIDHWIDCTDEFWYDDGFPGFEGPNQREREKAAEADLQEVLNAWFQRHKHMCPQPTGFAWCAGGEWIDSPAQAIEAGTAETGTGSVHKSAVRQDAPSICPVCNGAGGDNNTWVCWTCDGSGGVSDATPETTDNRNA